MIHHHTVGTTNQLAILAGNQPSFKESATIVKIVCLFFPSFRMHKDTATKRQTELFLPDLIKEIDHSFITSLQTRVHPTKTASQQQTISGKQFSCAVP